MNASAADIRSALSLDNSTSAAGPSYNKRTNSSNVKKPEGISRELYSLIGPSAPTLTAQLSKPRLKQKPNLGTGTRTRWEQRTFRNSGRTDGLELRHWIKTSSDPDADYPFAKYNMQTPNYTYSQDEYIRFLEDKEWTKEETDYLFNLVRDFDSRWYIIHDRYEYPAGPSRILDDLKDRYYSVCRKLVRNRPWAGDEASRAMLLSSFQFDKERELTRKKYLASLENRTQEQVMEEEALYLEIKKLEQNERRFKREREDLLRLLAGIDSGLPDITEDDVSSLGQLLPVDSKKKKKGALDSESPATPSASSISAPIIKRPQPTKNAAFDAQNCIIRTELPNTSSATKAAHQPAYLRSFKFPVPKAAIAPKVQQALAELKISPSRLVMPTRDNVAQLESLIEATMALIEMKRVVDKADYDIQVLRTRLGLKEDQEGEEVKAEGIDIDESNAEGELDEDGRAQSVASARSGRGSRKQSRRSMSVCSIDMSSRSNTKRQKRN